MRLPNRIKPAISIARRVSGLLVGALVVFGLFVLSIASPSSKIIGCSYVLVALVVGLKDFSALRLRILICGYIACTLLLTLGFVVLLSTNVQEVSLLSVAAIWVPYLAALPVMIVMRAKRRERRKLASAIPP